MAIEIYAPDSLTVEFHVIDESTGQDFDLTGAIIMKNRITNIS